MTQPLLSILIPTTPDREDSVNNLIKEIKRQCGNGAFKEVKGNDGKYNFHCMQPLLNPIITLTIFSDNKIVSIGEKREDMYKDVLSPFSWQIDDDDSISENAIQLILEAIKSNPEVDVISFEEHIDIDGRIEKSNHSLTYGDWEGEGGKELWDGFHYHRTPFFKSVIKTEIAKSIPIPHIRFGEDHQWAQLLKPHLKTEIHIPQQLYRYIHISSPFNERYGIPNI